MRMILNCLGGIVKLQIFVAPGAYPSRQRRFSTLSQHWLGEDFAIEFRFRA
ncbi:MAG TPA: hypothetical protein VJ001_15490 [Rhodocyclaceae bacterium]|nr:hypothetical protein [Rhodocyclaceae bacterium]